jgi:putative hydrolase of the HAD superfamily
VASPPRALLFDFDATLLDSRGVYDAASHACAEVAAAIPGLDPSRLADANETVFASYWQQIEEDWTLGIIDGASVSREVWRRTLQSCDIHDETFWMLAHECFAGHVRASHRLYDDATDLLRAVNGRLPLALITNGATDSQREKLQVTGIAHSFAAIFISGELGFAKPDPRIFKLALDQLQVAPEHAWHIGDNLATDVAGAQAAGVTSVWLNRRSTERKKDDPAPDIEIASLAELAGLLSIAGDWAKE